MLAGTRRKAIWRTPSETVLRKPGMSRRDIPGFRDTVSLGVRQIAFLLVPASIVTIVLAEPITRLIYQRGAFTSERMASARSATLRPAGSNSIAPRLPPTNGLQACRGIVIYDDPSPRTSQLTSSKAGR